MLDFLTEPDGSLHWGSHWASHWRLSVDGAVATLALEVDPAAAAADGYELKLNSYDIAVDVELVRLVRLIRYEQPEVGCVVITGGVAGTFCAGANIGMLAGATHHHKVNFCKFTNETRLEMEDASARSGLRFLAAINGACSGGGYELALACDWLLLIDDRSTAVSLPEVPLLGVLPGTGGLTRLVDKRRVRRDLADVFATRVEGCRGAEALAWGLVDELAPPSEFDAAVATRAAALVRDSRAAGTTASTDVISALGDASAGVKAPKLPVVRRDEALPVERAVRTSYVAAAFDRERRVAYLGVLASGDADWPLRCALELDAVLCHLRFAEPTLGTIVLFTFGDPTDVLRHDEALVNPRTHQERETAALWARALSRLDLTARSIICAAEPGSCFVGVLAELALAADRTYALDGVFEDERDSDAAGGALRDLLGCQRVGEPPTLTLTDVNFRPMPMANGLTRIASRFCDDAEAVRRAHDLRNQPLAATEAAAAGLVTFAVDDIDYDDELRIAIEERAAMSPDALTALEANHRFCGPETLATKIFGRLTAWQNWVFTRDNASGDASPLRLYGTGQRPTYDLERT